MPVGRARNVSNRKKLFICLFQRLAVRTSAEAEQTILVNIWGGKALQAMYTAPFRVLSADWWRSICTWNMRGHCIRTNMYEYSYSYSKFNSIVQTILVFMSLNKPGFRSCPVHLTTRNNE